VTDVMPVLPSLLGLAWPPALSHLTVPVPGEAGLFFPFFLKTTSKSI